MCVNLSWQGFHWGPMNAIDIPSISLMCSCFKVFNIKLGFQNYFDLKYIFKPHTPCIASCRLPDGGGTISKLTPWRLEMRFHFALQLAIEFRSHISLLIFDISHLTDTDDSDELRVIFDENRIKIEDLIKQISECFSDKDYQQAKYYIAKIKYFVNIEDKIKSKTFLH